LDKIELLLNQYAADFLSRLLFCSSISDPP
jgi:hypothetical protein